MIHQKKNNKTDSRQSIIVLKSKSKLTNIHDHSQQEHHHVVKHWDHDDKNHPLQLPFDGFADKAVAVVAVAVFLLNLHLNYHMAKNTNQKNNRF